MSGRPPAQIALLKNNERAKQEFSEGLISQILLLIEADKKDFFGTEQMSDFLDTAYKSLKVEHYTQKITEKLLEKIAEPTEQDIESFYNQFKNHLVAEGIVELNAQAIPYISQLIKGQQAQQQMMIKMSDLKNKSIIEINRKVIGK